MFDLFQLPAIATTQLMSKRPAGVPDLSVLYPRQRVVVDGILERLKMDGGCMLSLEGVAGSGKTYCTATIIEQLLSDNYNWRIGFCATTNQAVKVSYRSTEFTHPNLEYGTVHQFLALKEVIQRDGTIDFYPDKFIPATFGNYTVVFVDETSMLNRRIFSYILPFVEAGVKVVFIGDSFQIPPVKEADSIVYNLAAQRTHDIKVFQLTEIVRQAQGNPIIGITESIRGNMNKRQSFASLYKGQHRLFNGDKGAYFLGTDTRKEREFFDSLLKHVFTSRNFEADVNFAKAVAWRNKTVNGLNKGIRRLIYGEGNLRRIEPGEKLRTTAPVWDKETDRIIVKNAEMLTVIDFERHTENINNGQYILPYYETRVFYYDIYGVKVVRVIKIPTTKGQLVLKEILELLAKSAKSYTPGSMPASAAWREFYAFSKEYASITHGYAGTAHTTQGSTICNVIACEFDLDDNPRILEQNRIKYTTFSRPSERLFIL